MNALRRAGAGAIELTCGMEAGVVTALGRGDGTPTWVRSGWALAEGGASGSRMRSGGKTAARGSSGVDTQMLQKGGVGIDNDGEGLIGATDFAQGSLSLIQGAGEHVADELDALVVGEAVDRLGGGSEAATSGGACGDKGATRGRGGGTGSARGRQVGNGAGGKGPTAGGATGNGSIEKGAERADKSGKLVRQDSALGTGGRGSGAGGNADSGAVVVVTDDALQTRAQTGVVGEQLRILVAARTRGAALVAA